MTALMMSLPAFAHAEENKSFDAQEAVKKAKIGIYAPREPATPPAPSYTIRDDKGRVVGSMEPKGTGYTTYDHNRRQTGTVEPSN